MEEAERANALLATSLELSRREANGLKALVSERLRGRDGKALPEYFEFWGGLESKLTTVEDAHWKIKSEGVVPVTKEDEKGAATGGFSPISYPTYLNQQENILGTLNSILALWEPLSQIAERMDGQDNRATANPIFIVQERRRVFGIDTDWTGDVCWLYDGEEVAETEDELERFLRENDLGTEEDCLECGDLVKTGYIDTFERVQPFFSRKAADDYIETNRHNLTDPRVYVDSAYRNKEWQAVRGVLLEMVERSNA